MKAALEKGDIAGAQALCDKQRGTVASVVSSALIKYSEVEKDDTLSKEQKNRGYQKNNWKKPLLLKCLPCNRICLS